VFNFKAEARVQVARYISENSLDIKSDPFKYWNRQKESNNYPLLWNLVRKYLSAPCGSIESERLFSQAKNITTDLRNKMSSENLKKLLFLHENLSLINFEY
jgi:hypothetical protein